MYELILSDTLKVLKTLPTPVPSMGNLANLSHKPMSANMEMFSGDNFHFPLGMTYLNLGVCGVADRAEESAKAKTDAKQRELLLGIAEVYRELSVYFARYAQMIFCAAEAEKEAGKKDEYNRLHRISSNLKGLSERAPEHFDEALQLVSIIWEIRTLGWVGGADIGRLDVHLRPWFEKDIASGYFTEEQVLELIVQFWELLNESHSGDTLVNVMVGGRNVDGSDAGSRLSVLMLKATMRCAQTEPHMNVRVHKNLHPDIYRAMLEVQLMGQGQASVYNDEVIIPALMKHGVPEELACCYTNDGCCEIMLDGHSTIEFFHIDAVACFELAFNNGNRVNCNYRVMSRYLTKNQKARYYKPDVVPGMESGRPEDCESFDQFYQQFLRQYRFQVRNKANELHRMYADRLLGSKSSLLVNGTFDSVLDSGKDMLEGGLPAEVFMLFSGSIPTAADCLVAVKHLVFEQKKYTISQIKEAILANYEGYEVMRRQLLAAPKFGNDIDEVDLLAADIANHFCDWLEEYREETGFSVLPSLYGWRFVEEAHGVAATPDGRFYADPIAEHYCATPGRAICGPTAQLASIAKAKDAIARAAGNTVCHITLPRNLGNSDDESIEALDSLVQAAVAGGLSNMTIGIYDAELLRRAQKEPENYKDVIVRVWGFSARFVKLSEEMQEHVISRIPQVP